MAYGKPLLAIGLSVLFGGPALAETTLFGSDDRGFVLAGDLGLMNIDAGEFVYDGEDRLSQLDWESRGVVVFSVEAEAELKSDYLLKANFGAGMDGDSTMTDYDWLDAGTSDWTDRSLHPDTRLEHYVNGSLELHKRMWGDDDTDLHLGAGFKYTDLKWGAYGGSYVFSSAGGFRDVVGSFDEDERVISYRMQVPVTYASISATQEIGQLTLVGNLKAGLSLGIDGTDDHWMRDLRFYDRMHAAPMIGLDVTASYAMAENFSLHLGGAFEKIFEAGGDTETVDYAQGTVSGPESGAGASFRSMSFTFGVSRQF
jgi:omptin